MFDDRDGSGEAVTALSTDLVPDLVPDLEQELRWERAARERDRWVAGRDARDRALVAAERAAAVAYVAQLDAVLAVHEASCREEEELGWAGARDDAQLVAEAGLVVHLHRATLARRVGEADALRQWPVLRALLLSGALGVRHAVAAIEEVSGYGDPELAGRVLHTVLLSGVPGWQDTPTALVRALQRCVLVLDPQGCARRRAEREREVTGVRLRALSRGLAQLTATGNAPMVKAAHTLLGHLATPTGPEDERTAGQRQLDALCAALVGAAGGGVPVELQMEVPVHPATPAPVPAPGVRLDPVPIRSDLTGELLELLTGQPSSAVAAPPPADHVTPADPAERQDSLRPEGARPEGARLEPEGGPCEGPAARLGDQLPEDDPLFQEGPVDEGLDERLPDERDAEYIGAQEPPAHTAPAQPSTSSPDHDQQAGRPGGPAPESEPQADSAAPPEAGGAARRKPREGTSQLVGVGPVDPGLLRELLGPHAQLHGLPVGLSGITVRRLCVDPTGQVIAVDPVAIPLARLLAKAASTSDSTDASRSTRRRRQRSVPSSPPRPDQLLRVLLTDLPAPPPDTPNYRPTAAQKRVVRARDTHCTFPGCHRPAAGCELDHRTPWPAGTTSTLNLDARCKHHHDLKHRGWTPQRNPDGTTTWTSPQGRTATTRAE